MFKLLIIATFCEPGRKEVAVNMTVVDFETYGELLKAVKNIKENPRQNAVSLHTVELN